MSHDYDSLTNHSRQIGVQAPYKWNDLQETATHKEGIRIAGAASVFTRAYYHMGRWDSAEEENWVAEWFLWHSFRYRDNRCNKTAAQKPPDSHTASGDSQGRVTLREFLL